MKFGKLEETEHYVAIPYVEGAVTNDTIPRSVRRGMDFMEKLRVEGYKPMHFVKSAGVFMCEKPVDVIKEYNTPEVSVMPGKGETVEIDGTGQTKAT